MRGRLVRDGGSILIIAVVAMLVLGVLTLSFALLARIEGAISLDHKQQAQAEALAEAAIERAQDTLQAAASAPDGFTAWLDRALWSGAPQTPSAYAGQGAYWYRARVDNDCASLGTAPVGIEDTGSCTRPGAGNTLDANGTAVVTGWAQAGSGRARLRAILVVDDPWRRVCSGHRADLTGLCSAAPRPGVTPVLRPANPSDPHGPAVWDDLPRPYVGCSRIDPTLHADEAACAAHPEMYAAPHPPGPLAPRFVVMGPDPALTGGAAVCNPTGHRAYFGYFDCALATPCDGGVTNCNGTTRAGCLAADDPTDIGSPPYVGRFVKVQRDALGRVALGCRAQGGTGMVFLGDLPDADWGSPAHRVTVYVLQGTAALHGHTVHGTVVVEGDGGARDDLRLENRARIVTGPDPALGAPGSGAAQYGYPVAALVWDPGQAALTPSLPAADGSPQTTRAVLGRSADAGADRAEIHGQVYAGGRVELSALVLRGGLLAWAIQAEAPDASTELTAAYGLAPPGFPRVSGPGARIVRRALIACAGYHDEAAGATPCP